MRIAVPHNTTRAKARKVVEERLRALHAQYGNYANDVDHKWEGDTLRVAFKAKGMTVNGTIEFTDTDVIVDGKVPLLMKPFESRIRSTVEREAETMFRTA
ncbi:MAG TPA: polyhydroxyalkanoic acid system family protein [Thermoanaerobaculia bacterium]|nr:polyhydroxyalkanoic acid system family protein [Thermoanaerobaculia bacterium]